MTDRDTDESLVGAAMREIGRNGDRYYPIDNFVPLALSDASEISTKRFVLLLIAARSNHEINDAAKLQNIVAAIARQDPTAAFAALFQAYDLALDNPPRSRLSKEDFLCRNAIPLVPHLPKKDLPFCAAFIFDAAMYSDRGEKADRFVELAHAMLDRLDEAFPGEADRLWLALSSHAVITGNPATDIPVNAVVERIFSQRRAQPARMHLPPRGPRGDAAPDV